MAKNNRLMWFHALYPINAVLLCLGLTVFALLYRDQTRLAFFIVAMMVLEIIFGMGKVLLRSALFFIPSGLFIAVSLAWVTQDWHNIAPFTLQMSALWVANTVMLTVNELDMVRSLRTARVPKALTLGMLIIMRFTRIVMRQFRMIRLSRHTTCTVHGKRITNFRMTIPLMERVLTICDTLSDSLIMRCFRLDDVMPTTIYKPIYPTALDVCFTVSTIGIVAGVVLCPYPL